MRLLALLPFVTLALMAPAQDPARNEELGEPVDFLRDVRPILSQHCYACHGPDDATRKAQFRLDLKDEALRDLGDGAFAIVPGDPDDSVLMDRVTSDDRKMVMPPPKAEDPLSKAEIDILRRWIAQGADWKEHWAFVKPVRPEVPADSGGSVNAIDRFVRARLVEVGLEPAPAADKAALIRRVTFDLTGMPPTPEEINAFLGDESDDAYEKLVDRLLASPRYGERQAQEWLDVARYADTNGYQRDGARSAWKWREWVIKAFNKNMPFDQFTIEQLAGDLLKEPTLDQKIATGFNRNHPTNTEGGEEIDEYRTAYVMDRVNTTATTWLGLTVACAQCHDHKFDPIPQKDFYRFYAFFNQVKEKDSGRKPSMRVPNLDQTPHMADLKGRIAELKKRLESDDTLSDSAQRKWETKTTGWIKDDVRWTTATPIGMLAHNGSILERQKDGSILATGEAPVRDTYDLVFKPGKRKISAIRLEVLPSAEGGVSGRSRKGQFILSGLKLRLSSLSDARDPPVVFIAKADADLNQERPKEREPDAIYPGSIADSIVADDKPTAQGGGDPRVRGVGRGWSITGDERKRAHEAVLVPLETLKLNESSILRVSLGQSSRPYKTLIGRFRISFTDDERVRELTLPAVGKIWSAVGPFPAADAATAYKTAFEPEKELKTGIDLKKTYEAPKVPEKSKKGSGPSKSAKSDSKSAKSTKKPAAAKAEKPKQSGADSKPKGDAKPKAKPATAQAKPGAAKPKPATGASSSRRKRPPPKLAWEKHREWRDGRRASLKDGNVAWYLTRKITTTRARTVMMSFTGPSGVRAWLNGELIYEAAPKPTPTRRRGGTGGFGGGGFSRGRGRTSEDTRVQVGLRKGESELVVKVVFAGGQTSRGRRSSMGGGAAANPMAAALPEGFDPTAVVGFEFADVDPAVVAAFAGGNRRRSGGKGSFTFNLTPEGEDVVNHEIVTALRELAKIPTPDAGASKECGDDDKPTRSQVLRKKVKKFYRANIDTLGRIVKRELTKLERELQTLERKMPETLVMEEKEEKRDTHLMKRGDFKTIGEKVDAAVPGILPAMSKDLPKNRLGLAKWLLSPDNPLTARVLVNRVWQQYFGSGFVPTAEDFGIRSAAPSHLKLLDWLSTEFASGGWDLKKLHKLIVMSGTYRQSSQVASKAQENDPDNRLLACGPRQRLSAEMIRDNALAVSGLLVEKIGGESVKPYQPKGLWQSVARGQRYRQDKGEKQYRRGLYVYWKRGVPYPSAVTFDAAKRETCTVKRAETTTPLQALVLLNDPVYVEAAKMLGQRLLQKGGKDDGARIAFGFKLCTGTAPSKAQVAILTKLLVDQRAHYKSDVESAKKLLTVGDSKVADDLDHSELAAWTSVASALLNLDASIHR